MIFLNSQDMFCSWVCIFSFANHFFFWILCTSNDSNLFTGLHILICILIFLLISNFVERKASQKLEGKYCSRVFVIIYLVLQAHNIKMIMISRSKKADSFGYDLLFYLHFWTPKKLGFVISFYLKKHSDFFHMRLFDVRQLVVGNCCKIYIL